MGIEPRTNLIGEVHFPPGGMPPANRHASTRVQNGVSVVELRGEIDIAVASEVRAHTDAATATGGARLIADLRCVQFIDASGLSVLVRARRRVLERGGWMELVCTSAWHLRLMRAGRLDPDFCFHPVATVEDAMAGLSQKRDRER